MVPSEVPAPRGRPKRAAASKAEGVISEALSGSVDKPDERRVYETAMVESDKNALSEESAPMGWLQQRPGREAKRIEKGKAKKVPEVGSRQTSCATTAGATDTTVELSCGGRRSKQERPKRGAKRGRERGDRPIKSSRAGPSEQSRVKPKPPQGGSGVFRLLESFAGDASPKFDVPANPTMADAWKVLDIVLADLPSTASLSFDTLIALSGKRRSKRRDSWTRQTTHGSNDGAALGTSSARSNQAKCEVSANGGSSSLVASDDNNHVASQKSQQDLHGEVHPDPFNVAGARSIFLSDDFDDSCVFRHHQRLHMEQITQGADWSEFGSGKGPGHGAEQGDVKESKSADEEMECCAKISSLPRARTINEEMAACQAVLAVAESKTKATLGSVAAEINYLRYEPESEEMVRWNEWELDTILQYGPVEEQMVAERKARIAKEDEDSRREALRVQEELLAVCYVCDSGDHSEEDIVFCERCCVAVHTSCYQIVGVHELDKWYCDFCDDLISKARKRLDDTLAEEKRLEAISVKSSSTPMLISDSTETTLGEEDTLELALSCTTSEDSKSLNSREFEGWTTRCGDVQSGRPPRALSPLDTGAPGHAAPAAACGHSPRIQSLPRSLSPLDTSPLCVSSASSANDCTIFASTPTGNDSHGSIQHSPRHAPQSFNGSVGPADMFPAAEAAAPRNGEWSPTARQNSADSRGVGCHPGSSQCAVRRQSWSGPSAYPSPKQSFPDAGQWNTSMASSGLSGVSAVTVAAHAGQTFTNETKAAVSVASTSTFPVDQTPAQLVNGTSLDDPEDRAGAAAAAAAVAAAMAASMTARPSGAATRNGPKKWGGDGIGNRGPSKTGRNSQAKLNDLAVPSPTRDIRTAEDIARFADTLRDEPCKSKRSRSCSRNPGTRSCSSTMTTDVMDNRSRGNGSLSTFATNSSTASESTRSMSRSSPIPQHRSGSASPSLMESLRATASNEGDRDRRLTNGAITQMPLIAEQKAATAEAFAQRIHRKLEKVKAEVRAARVALEEAEEVVGIDTPSKDKGPREPDAVCLLCPVRGGAFHKADRIKKDGTNAWCHCLCALSKSLPILDRVVQMDDFTTGQNCAAKCSVCKRAGRGGLIGCEEMDCPMVFHPLCSNLAGGSADRGPHLPPQKWTAQCPGHAVARPLSPSLSALHDTGGDASASVKSRRKKPAADEKQRFQAEAKEAYATRSAVCPPGRCHRCRRERRWTASCSACLFRFCPSCICAQRESPMAVMAAVKAMAETVANRKPPPRDAFLCFVCRDTCSCGPCSARRKKAAAVKAKSARVAARTHLPPIERPAIVRAPKPPKPKSSAPPSDRKPVISHDVAFARAATGAAGGGTAAGEAMAAAERAGTEAERAACAMEKALAMAEATGDMLPMTNMSEHPRGDLVSGRKRSRSASQSLALPASPKKLAHVSRSPVFRPYDEGMVHIPSSIPSPASAGYPSQMDLEDLPTIDSTHEDILTQFQSCNQLLSRPDHAIQMASGLSPVSQPIQQDLNHNQSSFTSASGLNDRPEVAVGSPLTTQLNHDSSPSQGGVQAFAPSDPPRHSVANPSSGVHLGPGDPGLFPWVTPAPASATLPAAAAVSTPAPLSGHAQFSTGVPHEHAKAQGQHGPVSGLAGNVQGMKRIQWKTNGLHPNTMVRNCVSPRKVVCTVSGAMVGRTPVSGMHSAASSTLAGAPIPASAAVMLTSATASAPLLSVAATPAPLGSVTPGDGLCVTAPPGQPLAGMGVGGTAQDVASCKGVADNIPSTPPGWQAPSVMDGQLLDQSKPYSGYPMQGTPGIDTNGLPGVPLSVSPSPATTAAIMRAQNTRTRAIEAINKAGKAARDMVEAKSFSDRNNKAAMWRVEAATKLKDKLLMANELVSGYGGLRRNADEEARVAAAEETAAMAHLQEAENEVRRLTSGFAAMSNGWVNGSTMSTSGGAVISANGTMACTTQKANGTSMLPGTDNRIRCLPNNRPSSTNPSNVAWESSWWMVNQTSRGMSAGSTLSTNRPLAPATASMTAGLAPPPLPPPPPPPPGPRELVADARRRAAIAATVLMTARDKTKDKKSALAELVERLNRAEAGRAELVKQTQWASEAASKASAAAMHYEDVARTKKKEEQASREGANMAEWEARKAELDVRTAAEMDISRASRVYYDTLGSTAALASGATAMGGAPPPVMAPQNGLIGANGVHMKGRKSRVLSGEMSK